MSYVDGLLQAYRRFVALPWQKNLASQERIWMAVYPPEQERRIRLYLDSFKAATMEARHPWGLIDITHAFEEWMAGHEYRDSYFKNPRLLGSVMPSFFDALVDDVRTQLDQHPHEEGVVGLVGTGALFGLSDSVRVSTLLKEVNDHVSGRLLVLFPGDVDNNNFRLLDARDGWDYMAIVIRPDGG